VSDGAVPPAQGAAKTAPNPDGSPPVFTIGSTMQHVVVMTATGSVGLIAIFFVDFLSLLYVSWLKDTNLTAAVGYATTVLFLTTSICIGLMIAVGALVSRALGARDRDRARRLAGSSLVQISAIAALVGVLVALVAHPALVALGAKGETLDVAFRFLMISLPSTLFIGLGMGFSGVLRAVGDARRAMYVTLAGGIATAILDPILIFGLGLGVDGAAISTIISRLIFSAVGYHGAVVVHRLVARPNLRHAIEDLRPMLAIAGPAVLANVATPVAAAFMTSIISPFGDAAVAANAIISRVVPVAFGVVFALSGAVGAILGQNLGARLYDRVRRAFTDSLLLAGGYVIVAWGLLALAPDAVNHAFSSHGETAEIVRFFCLYLAGTWLFHGALFVANAAFNNLGFPLLSTAFNWGKATLGTIPFAMAGAKMGGAIGALVGQGVGAIFFGVAGVAAAYWAIGRLAARDESTAIAARADAA
jgi:putative MATE family efflux protein